MTTSPGSVRQPVSAPVSRNTTETIAAAAAAAGAYRLADVLVDMSRESEKGRD